MNCLSNYSWHVFSWTQVLLLAMAPRHQTAIIMLTTKWVSHFLARAVYFHHLMCNFLVLQRPQHFKWTYISVTLHIFLIHGYYAIPSVHFVFFLIMTHSRDITAWTTRSTVGPLPISPPWLSKHLSLPRCHGSNAPFDAGRHTALQSGSSAIPAGEDDASRLMIVCFLISNS